MKIQSADAYNMSCVKASKFGSAISEMGDIKYDSKVLFSHFSSSAVSIYRCTCFSNWTFGPITITTYG